MMFTRGRRSLISLISHINRGYYEQACTSGPIEGWGSDGALAVTFRCLFCRMEQEVRKVAIWWVFISRWLPRWLNVSWRWSCRQLRGRAGPEAQGVPPGCSSSPLKEGQQSNESRSAPNLQLVLCQLYCFFPTILSVQLESNPPTVSLQKCFTGDWTIPRRQSFWNLMSQNLCASSDMPADARAASARRWEFMTASKSNAE